MIRLNKGPEPQTLIDNKKQWTDTLLNKIAAGEAPTMTEKTRYRDAAIKSALIAETNGKCAYCESIVIHVAPGDIEHIQPKSVRPEKSFEWENLTLACPECNRRKNDNDFADSTLFVDPYKLDPEEYFWFAGPIMLPSPGIDAAFATWKELGLGRDALFDVRKERIADLNARLNNVARAQNPDVKRMLIEELNQEYLPSKQFSAMSRKFITEGLARMG